MKKRGIALLMAALLGTLGCQMVHAEAVEPDFESMTAEEWYTYEWYMDASTIFADITSYDADYIRENVSELHTNGYTKVVMGEGDLSEEEKREYVQKLHDARINTPQLNDPEEKRIYLWPDGAVPTVTEYTENPGYFFGNAPDFQPYLLECLVEEEVEPKGAVIIAAGGSKNLRCNLEEGIEVADALNKEGYQCFIVNYRLKPYTDEESALDYARAVRYVRANAEKYRIDENKIAGAGFSYGGIVIAKEGNWCAGDINASALVESYEPDELDAVSADLNAYLAIYSVSYNDSPDEMVNPNFPPTFFCVGGNDGIWNWVMGSFNKEQEMGITSEIHTFAGAPHGFGAGTDGVGNYYANAATWPSLADDFMQDVYAKNAVEE